MRNILKIEGMKIVNNIDKPIVLIESHFAKNPKNILPIALPFRYHDYPHIIDQNRCESAKKLLENDVE